MNSLRYTYKLVNTNNLLFNVIYYNMYSIVNMYVECLIHLASVSICRSTYFSSISLNPARFYHILCIGFFGASVHPTSIIGAHMFLRRIYFSILILWPQFFFYQLFSLYKHFNLWLLLSVFSSSRLPLLRFFIRPRQWLFEVQDRPSYATRTNVALHGKQAGQLKIVGSPKFGWYGRDRSRYVSW